MNSFINVFIYEVQGPQIFDKYSFHGLFLKTNNNNHNSLIVPRELEKKSNRNKIYSKNIIRNKKRNEKNIELNNYNNMPFLYKIYKTLPARISVKNFPSTNKELKNNIYDKLKKLIVTNTTIFRSYLQKNSDHKTNKMCNKLKFDSELIYNLDESDESKIIIMGDNHGSFHSFFRVILRLYITGIINKNYKLKKNYKLILLGDIVDRGNYGVELLYILLNLMSKNNSPDNLNVILVRGNHEEEHTYNSYGFSKELFTKFFNNFKSSRHLHFYNVKSLKNVKLSKNFRFSKQFVNQDTINIFFLMRNFFKYCPSAIILNHLKTRYWLCHGGFPISFKKNFGDDLVKNNKNSVFIHNIKESSEIRWNDFSGSKDTVCSTRNRCDNTMHIIGTNSLKEFLEYLNIDFIIRGHTDDESNAMLLMKSNNNNISYCKECPNNRTTYFRLNLKKNISFYEKYKNNKNNVLEYKCNEKNINNNKSKKEPYEMHHNLCCNHRNRIWLCVVNIEK
jgi:hypothetical protein